MPFGKKGVAGTTADRRRLTMVLMPARSGKSGLVEKMSHYISATEENRVIFLDVDALAQAIKTVNHLESFDTPGTAAILEQSLFPLLHNEIKKYLDSDSTTTIVLLTCNSRFPDYKDIAVKEKRRLVFLPSRELFNTIYDQLEKQYGKVVAEVFGTSRDELLLKYAKSEDKKGEAGYFTYETLDDIVKIVAEQLKLKVSAI